MNANLALALICWTSIIQLPLSVFLLVVFVLCFFFTVFAYLFATFAPVRRSCSDRSVPANPEKVFSMFAVGETVTKILFIQLPVLGPFERCSLLLELAQGNEL